MNRLLGVLFWLGHFAPVVFVLLFAPLLAYAADGAAPLGFLANLQAHAVALGLSVGGPIAAVVAFLIAGRTVPGIVVGKLRRVFEEAKTSPWWRAGGKPHRAKFLYAAFVFLEAEVPNEGEGQEVYDAFGAWANAHARVGGVPLGSASQWASLARKGGDAIDLELDREVVELAQLVEPPASDPPPAAA